MLNQGISPHLPEIALYSIPENDLIETSITPAITIAAFATGILGSAYMAYHYPYQFVFSTLTIATIHLHTLPYILLHCNFNEIKVALVTNITALNCLSIGGGLAISLQLIKHVPLSILKIDTKLIPKQILASIFVFVTSIFSAVALIRAYNILNNPDHQDRLHIVCEELHKYKQPELGFLNHIWQKLILQCALLHPDLVLNTASLFKLNLRNALPMIVALVSSEKSSVDNFNHLLLTLENFAEEISLQEKPLYAEMKNEYFLIIKIAMRLLLEKDCSLTRQALTLIEKISTIVPHVISNDLFLQLFQGKILHTTNELIEQLLLLFKTWNDLKKRFQKLSDESSEFKTKIQHYDLEKMKDEKFKLNQEFKFIQNKYTKLRTEIQNVYKCKRVWKKFWLLWEKDFDVPFHYSNDLISIFNNQTMLKEIDDIYRAIIKDNGGQQMVTEQLQFVKNKLETLLENEIEEPAIFYLATHCGFILEDYEKLKIWFDLDSLNDLEEEMEKIGLSTQTNLYDKGILLHDNARLPKDQISTKLHTYIVTNRHFISAF